jgi:UDP-N-acetylglucosamine 2-epimerase (non-hydrolysing)
VIERVVLVAGTRPEFVKLHPIATALAAKSVPTILVTTEQHSSPLMKDRFFDELRWPCPVVSLGLEDQEPLRLLSGIFERLPDRLNKNDLVIVEGDTTSVLGASLVANKLRLRLAHVEAGLRSYDLRMPEEHNRRLCDHIADFLFAPTEFDANHLRDERCPGGIAVTGNTALDAVRENISRAERPEGSGFVLITVHRQENVDDPLFLREVVRFLALVPHPCVFPVHPRTQRRLRSAGLWTELLAQPTVKVCEPMGYLAFLGAMSQARVILTDSGGVQEEATAPEIRRPTIVLRRSTERAPAIEAGFSILAPARASVLCERVADLSWFHPQSDSPFGNGRAAKAILAALTSELSGIRA